MNDLISSGLSNLKKVDTTAQNQKPPEKEMTFIDLIKSGQYSLRKVDPSTINQKPVETKPMSHIDLIKAGQFKLRKVDLSKPPPPKPKEEVDPSKLSLQEILQRAASIREAVECSDSSESESGSETSTTEW